MSRAAAELDTLIDELAVESTNSTAMHGEHHRGADARVAFYPGA